MNGSSGKATAAGIILIVQGALGVAAGLAFFFFLGLIEDAFDLDLGTSVAAIGLVFAIPGVLVILTGVGVLRRRTWARIAGFVVEGLVVLGSLGELRSGRGFFWLAVGGTTIWLLATSPAYRNASMHPPPPPPSGV